MKKFKQLLQGIPAKLSTIDIVFIFLWTLIDCYFVTLLSNLTANAINQEGQFLKAAIFFIIYILGWEFLEYIADVNVHMINTNIENNTYMNTFNELYTTSPEVLKKSNTGFIAGLLNKIIHRKERAYLSIFEWLLMAIFYNLYVIFYMAKYSWWFSLTVFAMSALGTIVRIIALKATKEKVDKLSEAEALRTKIFMDATTNIGTVQKLRSKEFMNKKMKEINDSCLKVAKKWAVLDELFFCLYKFIMYMICPVCLIVMFFIENSCNFDKVEFMSFLAITEVKLIHYSKNIANAIKDYGLWRISQDKMDSITQCQSQHYVGTSIGNNFNTIELRDISYSYQKDDKSSVTVNVPHFKVNKGDFVCICGESGQGKTTTLNILSGSIEGQSIFINGELSNKNIGAVYIAQDVEMFDMSLRDNLTLGYDVPDEELIKLLDCVGLKEWFDSQKNGLETILGERGVFVSTGQRQRLNLLRGLLIKDKDIYMLDEPTSNVDEATEEKMIELIKERLKDKTVIIVTHREKIKEICNKHYRFTNGTMYEENI